MTIFGKISLFLGSIFSSIFSFPYKVTFSSPLSDLTYFYFCYDLIFKTHMFLHFALQKLNSFVNLYCF